MNYKTYMSNIALIAKLLPFCFLIASCVNQKAEQVNENVSKTILPPAKVELFPESPIHTLTSRGQIDEVFPQKQRSSRELVNDRTIFKSYRRRGNIIINNKDAVSADIYVNGQKLNIAQPMQAYNTYRYSLKKRTKNGENTLRVENIIPEHANLAITIPYPTLSEKLSNRLKRRYKKSFEKVDALIEEDINNGFPGAVLLVIKDGFIIKHKAYGYKRKYAEDGKPLTHPVKMTQDTLFDLASNTKVFATNFALMKLVSEERLNVNLPISFYLPLYQGEGRELRTVKDMLTHNAGYAPQVRFFTKDNHLGEDFYSQSPQKTKALIMTKVPFDVPRNTKHMYSDTDFMLLGMLIEKITGVSLDVYLEQEVYQRLNLVNTLFTPLEKGRRSNQFAATEIQGTTRGGRVDFNNIRDYVLQGEVHDEKAFHSFSGVAGHAGLFSTAADLAVLAQTLLNRGGYGDKQLFSTNVMSQFIKPDDENGTYGLGWRRANSGEMKWHFGPYASPSTFGHTGWTGTATVIDPQHDLAIILLTNARHSEIDGDNKHYHFKGKQYETAKYGSVISSVYEAVLNSN